MCGHIVVYRAGYREHRFSHPTIHQRFEERYTHEHQRFTDPCYGEEHGLHGTSEILQMRERVRKEWWSICGKTYNACERPASSYGDLSRTPWCYLKKRWFIDHLNKKGIPYDDLVVNDVTGVTFYESQKRTSQAYMRKLR